MSNRLTSIRVKNFRSLANVTLDSGPLNVLFGPNGAGKSTFLDTIWFVRDCAIRGVEQASSDRSHGIGLMWDGAEQGSGIHIGLETELAKYDLQFNFASGRIENFIGEILYSKRRQTNLIEREVSSDKAKFFHIGLEQHAIFTLREPGKPALNQYLVYDDNSQAASELDRLLHYTSFYNSRSIDLYGLKKFGSESGPQSRLEGRAQNLWSVLRILNDRRSLDDRYDTILNFMRKSFPHFQNIVIEQTGPSSIYASFIEKGHAEPIQASGVSDGHLQMLILLTALFSQGPSRDALLMFDEPEISLHPYALATFAEAVKLATKKWNKQVFIATHSPVLISQFEPDQVIAVESDSEDKTAMRRASEIEGIKDLLDQYATGSLYMAEAIAPQSKAASEMSVQNL